MSSKTCGSCQSFIRVKSFGDGRSGVCDKYDYSLKADCCYAKYCKGYTSKKYERHLTTKPDKQALT